MLVYRVCQCVPVCVCQSQCAYVCMSVCVCVVVSLLMCVCVCLPACVCVCRRVCVCVCVCLACVLCLCVCVFAGVCVYEPARAFVGLCHINVRVPGTRIQPSKRHTVFNAPRRRCSWVEESDSESLFALVTVVYTSLMILMTISPVRDRQQVCVGLGERGEGGGGHCQHACITCTRLSCHAL